MIENLLANESLRDLLTVYNWDIVKNNTAWRRSIETEINMRLGVDENGGN